MTSSQQRLNFFQAARVLSIILLVISVPLSFSCNLFNFGDPTRPPMERMSLTTPMGQTVQMV